MTEPLPKPNLVDAASILDHAIRPEFSEQHSESNLNAAEDEVLDRLLGITHSNPTPPVEPASEPARVPSPPPAKPDPDLDRAIRALQRDGVPSDVVQSMMDSPDKLKSWGLKSAKRQADVDAFGSQVRASKAEPPPTSQSQPVAQAQSGDAEDDADPLSSFGQIFGDDAAKPLRALAKQMRAEFDTRTQALEARHEAQTAYLTIANEYGPRAPSFDVIRETAAEIGRTSPNSFPSITEVVRAAFIKSAGPAKRVDHRDASRPTVGVAAQRAVAPRDIENDVLDVLLAGGSRSDALRAASR